jgi:hypothetical protein
MEMEKKKEEERKYEKLYKRKKWSREKRKIRRDWKKLGRKRETVGDETAKWKVPQKIKRNEASGQQPGNKHNGERVLHRHETLPLVSMNGRHVTSTVRLNAFRRSPPTPTPPPPQTTRLLISLFLLSSQGKTLASSYNQSMLRHISYPPLLHFVLIHLH